MKLARRSAKRQERFKDIALLYDEAHEPIRRLHAVRWLSQGQVLKSVTGNINSIADLALEMMRTSTATVDDEDDEGDEGDSEKKLGPKEVYERLTDFKYVAALFFLTDLISVVNMVSVSFQYHIMESSVSFVASQISLLKTHVETSRATCPVASSSGMRGCTSSSLRSTASAMMGATATGRGSSSSARARVR